MDDNDFYEDDQPVEEVRAAWKRGDKGETSGSRDLNERARSVVDRAIERWDSPGEVGNAIAVAAESLRSLQISGVRLVSSEVDVRRSGNLTIRR